MKNLGLQSILILLTGMMMVVALLVSLNNNSQRFSEDAMIASARSYSKTFTGIRNFYQENVVSRLQGTDVIITHDFRNFEGSIPIPATMMLELTSYLNQLGGDVTFSLASDYPFPWRNDRNLLELDTEALIALRGSEKKEFYKFYEESGITNLYYSSPIIMQEGCIDCHNNHPDSPKTDWKVGDVRAVQVFDIPTDVFISDTKFSYSIFTAIILLVSSTTIFTLLFMNAKSQRTQSQLTERAAELIIANEEKESVANDLTQLIDTANAPIFGIDAAGRVNEWNQRAELLTGFGKADVIGKDLVAGFITDDYKVSVKEVLDKALKGEESANFEFPLFTKSGDRVDVLLNSTSRRDPGGNIIGVVGVGQDITRQRRQREELIKAKNETEFQALHDPLTKLVNRRGLDAAYEARKSYNITEGTLIHIDLDHFKNVNDNMGHTTGDFVLSEVGRILTSEVRSRNGERLPDIVARTGGDEFVVLLGPQATTETAKILSTRLLAKICEPMPFESILLQIGASFGIASTHDGLVSSLSDLLAAADAALYDAKDSGRNCIRSYTESLHCKVVEQRQLALKFGLAISDSEFEPYFQPQFDAHTGKLSGVEVLARWPSEQLGLVTPDTFLPIARQLYMMGELDQIIFDKASDQIMTLHRKGIRVPKISFNVTAERVISGGALKAVRSLSKNRPQISIEVLESVIVEDQLDVFWIEIEKLRKLGIGIEIDDFGSGYTSLVGALELQPDVLKIDRRLIIPITTSNQAKKMLEQIVGMAKIIGLKITAEGVETIEHAKIATDCGCDILQGFGLALPMPIAELEAFLENNADLFLSSGTTPHRWTETSVRST